MSLDAITLVVNGEVHQVVVEPQWTLQYVLMDKLGLTGTKEFCAEGACGACSVIIDGRPVLSCMMLAIECDGRRHRDHRGHRPGRTTRSSTPT